MSVSLVAGLSGLAWLAVTATAVVQQPLPVRDDPWSTKAHVCVARDGRLAGPAALCAKVPHGRLDCRCPAGATPALAPVCKKSEAPAPESAAVQKARLAYAARGTLDGARVSGRSLCVAMPYVDSGWPSDDVQSLKPQD